MSHIGEFAAVATAVCWACAAAFFVSAGRRMGSMHLNRLRLLVAAVPLAAALWIAHGTPIPLVTLRSQFVLLAASGIIGFAFADSFYFRALVILGAGRTALLLALAPLFTAVFARWWIDERLGPQALVGMAMTLGGLALVLGDRRQALTAHREGSAAFGVVCGVLAAIGAAAGYVLSRMALATGIDALSATAIRVVTAAAAVWIVAMASGRSRGTGVALRDRFAVRMMVGGALCGPFAGVTLSLVALRHTQAAVATSIFACSPLLAVVLGARFHGEPLTARIGVGALLAVAGVIVLFLRP